MTTTNGWPGKPGVPLHPEKDGWHWVHNNFDGLVIRFWGATFSEWDGYPLWMAQEWTYLGPCLTPDEVQNLRDDLASAERERAHQHGRADRNATEYAREQGKRKALQARVAELERALRPFAGVGEFIAKHHPDPETDQNHETATLVRHFRNAHVALEGKKDSPTMTEEQLREMMRDPRYWRQRNPEWVKRVTDGFRALVGGKKDE